jgi:hypothetical protein
MMIAHLRFQCKRRKRLGEHIKPSEEVHGQLIREDRGETYAVIRYSTLLNLLKGGREMLLTIKEGVQYLIELEQTEDGKRALQSALQLMDETLRRWNGDTNTKKE